MNQKNFFALNECFLDLDDPIELFTIWMNKAKKSEPNDPNALSLATSDKKGVPSVRMVLLKDFSKHGFIFYTNFNSPKSTSLKENPKAEMCFYWKSLLRQVRINGKVSQVKDEVADDYYNSRDRNSQIGAWASKQSSVLKNRDELIKSIKDYEKKYLNQKKIPRPPHWSGWNLIPFEIEFWMQGKNRIHERLNYTKKENGNWERCLLSP